MKDNPIHVFIYLTGAGWHILKEHGFLDKYCQHQFPVTAQFGCSHAAISTTLTGVYPDKHGHFSSYYFKKSDGAADFAQRLYCKFKGKNSGYFGKYSIPMRNLSYFLTDNHCEKKLTPGYFAPLISIVDLVNEKKIANTLVNAATGSPIQALKSLRCQLENKSVDFAFIQIDELDKVLHHSPHNFQKIDNKLRRYERQIKKIIAIGNSISSKFNLTVLSGHGMTFAPQTINVKEKIDSLGMDYGYDYHAVYDPTMARFWFKDKFAKLIILDKIKELRHCRILTDEEKQDFGINFPDQRYGETIALAEPGFQILPNDVLAKPLAGMHCYDPNHPDSLGACLSTQAISPAPSQVKDFFTIMSNFIAEHE